MIAHGHITVNGRRVDIPSYLVRPGDVIRVKNRPKSLQLVQAILAEPHRDVPDFLSRVGRPVARRTRAAAAGSRRRVDSRAAPTDRRALFQVAEARFTGLRGQQLADLPVSFVESGGLPRMRIRWRGLELPSLSYLPERSTLTATYGKFMAEPFERGFGVTIGNSLRRILLSSLEGSAVTQIKLHGAQHEFSTLPGVSKT